MIISRGFEDTERPLIADMYWQAFGGKLGSVMGPEARATAFIRDTLDPSHAICARSAEGEVLGVVGFKTYESALVNGDRHDMMRHYGTIGATWRGTLMSMLMSDVENQRFVIDGVFVRDTARGMGVGTRLLDAAASEARSRGYAEVRLDVIDTNTRARALYERCGFTALAAQNLGILRHVFGFRSATPMTRFV